MITFRRLKCIMISWLYWTHLDFDICTSLFRRLRTWEIQFEELRNRRYQSSESADRIRRMSDRSNSEWNSRTRSRLPTKPNPAIHPHVCQQCNWRKSEICLLFSFRTFQETKKCYWKHKRTLLNMANVKIMLNIITL